MAIAILAQHNPTCNKPLPYLHPAPVHLSSGVINQQAIQTNSG